MMDATQRAIAQKNREVKPASWDKLRRDEIVKGIRRRGIPSPNEENAVFRKTLSAVIDLLISTNVITQDEADCTFAEFLEQTAVVNGVKETVKENMGDGGMTE